jgi:hypothetical protein
VAEPAPGRQRPAAPPDDRRIRLIRAVRGACRQQGIDDDDRKALQQQIVGKASMSDMTIAEMARLLDHLNRGTPGPAVSRPHVAKAKALWRTLYCLGEVDDDSDRALGTFVKRMTGVAALRFLDHGRAAIVIEALKSWAERAGVRWPNEAETCAITAKQPDFTIGKHDRHAVVSAMLVALANGGALLSPSEAYLRSALGLGPNHWLWTAPELDECIRLLGRKMRKMKGKD